MTDIEKIREVVEKYCEAIHSQDEKEFKNLWSGDAFNIEISGSKIFRGVDSIYEDFVAGMLNQRYSEIRLINDGLEINLITADTAIAVFSYHTECIVRDTGEPHGIAGLETQVLKKIDDEWKLVHIQYAGKSIKKTTI